METPLKLGQVTVVLPGDQPNRKPFRVYFGLTYLILGISLLVYMGNR